MFNTIHIMWLLWLIAGCIAGLLQSGAVYVCLHKSGIRLYTPMEPILQFALFSCASIFVCVCTGCLTALLGFSLPISTVLTVVFLFITGWGTVRRAHTSILKVHSEYAAQQYSQQATNVLPQEIPVNTNSRHLDNEIPKTYEDIVRNSSKIAQLPYKELLKKITGLDKPNELLTESQFDEWCQRRNLSEYSSDSGSLQFDGLYRADGEKYDNYLRFYPDDSALSVVVIKPSTVEKVAWWLGKDNETVSHGKYEQRGTQIALTEHIPNGGTIYFRGVVINDHMIYLESYTHDIEYHWYHYQKTD